ncbi:MAG: DUF1343 domain-containing protein [Armatimonadota bacterium]|nr:DUF1343 domain-containing protein [bacterium]
MQKCSEVVLNGLDVLLNELIPELAHARVGILANHASVNHDLIHIADAVVASGVRVEAVFAPEHGARGDSPAGAHVDDYIDQRLGVPVHSLYGPRRTPDASSLGDIDLMLIDVQDVGSRFYTFTSTMANMMIACGKLGIPVWVLDRPNPISGLNPEGPILDPAYSSFVGLYPIPIRHALTIGELALLFVKQFGVECDLRVVRMRGWQRSMHWDDTGIAWLRPSPNMVYSTTALVYPGTCLFEGTNVSEGRGTSHPFEIIGAPWLDSRTICELLKSYQLPGVEFQEEIFTPDQSKYKSISCTGLYLSISDRNSFRPVLTGVAILCAIMQAYSDRLAFIDPGEDGRMFFDLLAGNSELRKGIGAGHSPSDIAASWTNRVARFNRDCENLLLYC